MNGWTCDCDRSGLLVVAWFGGLRGGCTGFVANAFEGPFGFAGLPGWDLYRWRMSWFRDLNEFPQVRHVVRHCASLAAAAG